MKAPFVKGDAATLPSGIVIAVGGGERMLRTASGVCAETAVVADGEIEAAVALDDLGDGGAADGCLECGVDVCSRDAVARGIRAVDGDEQAGLAADFEDAYVGDTLDVRHGLLDLVGEYW